VWKIKADKEKVKEERKKNKESNGKLIKKINRKLLRLRCDIDKDSSGWQNPVKLIFNSDWFLVVFILFFSFLY